MEDRRPAGRACQVHSSRRGPIEQVVEQITVMFVMLGLWVAVVSAGVGVAVMFRLDAIERKMDSARSIDADKRIRRTGSRLR